MSTIATACNRCGQEFEPDLRAIRAGTWRTCPTCEAAAPPPPPEEAGTRCRECGRPLRDGKRDLCLGCLLGGPLL